MRRFISAAAAVLLLAGVFVVVGTQAANASVTSPSANEVLRGTATLSDTGGTDQSSILGFHHCSGSVNTTLQLINSSNTVVFSQGQSGSGTMTVTITTENYPNGSYTVRGIDGNGENSGFGGFGCKTVDVTQNVHVTIDNIVSLSYSGATSAPQNTSIPVSATLTDPSLGVALSGKTVSFGLSGGATVNASTNASGVASTTLPIGGPPRTTPLVVSFAATPFYDAKSLTFTFTVDKDQTSTTLTPPAPVVHGQATHFTATVAATQGTGTPTGDVQFTVDGSPFGPAVALVNGVATTPNTTALSTASHTVGASYAGDGNFLGSSATTVTQVVNAAATTTTLDSSPNPSVTGQGVTFTATVDVVAPGAGTPTGGVQFFIDGNPSGTAVNLTGNTAALTVSNLPTGNHDVTATYNGTADFLSSSSATVTQGVNRADTSVALSSSDSPSVTGEGVTFTATVSAVAPGSGTPDGQVQFAVDGVDLGDPVTLVDGSASSSSISTLTPGNHTVTADYSGSAGFSGQSQSFTQTVNPAATTSTVTSDPNPSVFGQPVTFSATVAVVAPGTGTPTGFVQFFVDGVASGTPVTLVGGQADSAPVATMSTGTHAITVEYLGDGAYLPSASQPITQTVNKAPTTLTLTPSVNPSVFGQPVVLNVHVAAAPPGAGNPTGTVSFTFTSIPGVVTVPLNALTGDAATVSISTLPVGQTVITATYNGDGNFLTSTDSVTQTVQRAHTSTVVTSSANPAQSGQSVTFTATVTPVAPGAGNPTGTVIFSVNGAPLGSPVPVVNGVATSSAFASLSPGTYSIAAAYSGDGNFLGSSGVLDQGNGQTIGKGDTSMSLSADQANVAYAAPVTFTATVTAVPPASGHPTGVVQFYDGTALLGSSSLAPGDPNSSTATFVTTTLSPGPHSIQGVYVGNFNFNGQSASATTTVGTISTVTGVGASPNPATYGGSVTLTAQVSASSGNPTGTVTFYEGSAVLGTASLSTIQSAQQASITVPGWNAGTHTVHAVYSGATQFAASTSANYDVTVNRAASKVVADQMITCSPTGCTGNGGYVRATLTGVNGAPLAGRTLTFSFTQSTDHATVHICDAVTDASGVASCYAASWVPAITFYGGYDVNFLGDGDYLPSTDHGTVA